MINMYLFLRKNRLKKKGQLYKRVFLLSFDWTLLFYVALVIGYGAAAIILDGQLISRFQNRMIQLEGIASDQFAMMIVVLPLFYIIRAWQQPGVLFSQAEYLLTVLPFRRRSIWWTLAIARWVQATIVFTVAGLFYYLFSATEFFVICLYVLLLVGINILMTVIEWKVFQLPIWLKAMFTLCFIVCIVAAFFTEAAIIALIMGCFLSIGNIIGYRYLMSRIHWQKVTAAVDFKIWNMIVIGHVTKIKFKKNRTYTFWQRLSFWKRPFAYGKDTLYHRLWQLHFEKNMKHIAQLFGALLLLLAVFGYLQAWLFLLGIVIAIHIYINFLISLFKERFTTDVVAVLPLDLTIYRRAFMVWAYCFSIIWFIPMFIFLFFQPQVYYFVIFGIVIFLFIVLLRESLLKTMHLMENSIPYQERVIQASYLGMFFLFLSYFHIVFLYAACVLVLFTVGMKIWGRRWMIFNESHN